MGRLNLSLETIDAVLTYEIAMLTKSTGLRNSKSTGIAVYHAESGRRRNSLVRTAEIIFQGKAGHSVSSETREKSARRTSEIATDLCRQSIARGNRSFEPGESPRKKPGPNSAKRNGENRGPRNKEPHERQKYWRKSATRIGGQNTRQKPAQK